MLNGREFECAELAMASGLGYQNQEHVMGKVSHP